MTISSFPFPLLPTLEVCFREAELHALLPGLDLAPLPDLGINNRK